ncbi:MAG: bacteriocin-like protein [Mucilaginibacter sp.]
MHFTIHEAYMPGRGFGKFNSIFQLFIMNNFKKLNRVEMKNVLGGRYPVTCTTTGSGGTSTFGCTNNDLDACQDAADAICEGSDSCDDITCKYT